MIEVTNLTFGYSKKSLLFKNLNLKLEAGHIYGLLGKNGAGKSTLLKNLAGLVYPIQGSCMLKGYKAAERLPSFLRELFFIAEEIYLPNITAAAYMRGTAHFYPGFREEQFLKILAEFDVPVDQTMKNLSFGQQKKVMIAFGIAANTALLIMDEPTNGLDIPSKVQFRKVIASVLSDERCIIISTHQVRDLDSLIDQLIVLHDQKIALNSSIEAISERVQFTTSAQANPAEIIYREDGGIGINTICSNADGHAGKVDTELLFNAITSGNQSLIDILNK